MKVLVDTNVLVFSLTDDSLLSSDARRAMVDPKLKRVTSVAALWEMTIKISLGKLSLPESPHSLWRQMIATDPESVLSVSPGHLECLSRLPHHHRDPFDRLMIAQALEEGWKVVSSDAQWDAYGVTRIW